MAIKGYNNLILRYQLTVVKNKCEKLRNYFRYFSYQKELLRKVTQNGKKIGQSNGRNTSQIYSRKDLNLFANCLLIHFH